MRLMIKEPGRLLPIELKEWRERRGLSPIAFAVRCEMTADYYLGLEEGFTRLSPASASAIKRAVDEINNESWRPA